MAVPDLDSADFHFPFQTIIKIQNDPETAQLYKEEANIAFFCEENDIKIQLKDTFPVLENVNFIELIIFFLIFCLIHNSDLGDHRIFCAD